HVYVTKIRICAYMRGRLADDKLEYFFCIVKPVQYQQAGTVLIIEVKGIWPYFGSTFIPRQSAVGIVVLVVCFANAVSRPCISNGGRLQVVRIRNYFTIILQQVIGAYIVAVLFFCLIILLHIYVKQSRIE